MIVTLISPIGEYGGPLRVALNQARALTERGHHVVVAGAYRGFKTAPVEIEGLPVKLFAAKSVSSKLGFAGTTAPGLWRWLRTQARTFDVAHIHLGRDLVTLPAARIVASRRLRYVLQTHGMIDPSARWIARPIDAALTRPAFRRAHRIFYLNDSERHHLIDVARGEKRLRLMELPNGVPTASDLRASGFLHEDVLYLARIAPRKRPMMFLRVAEVLSSEFPEVQFSLVGPDEGEGKAVLGRLEALQSRGCKVLWEGPVPPSAAIERMLRASLYVLPSVDEPYPMAALEAMSVGLPVVITDSCGLSDFVRTYKAGLVVDHSEQTLVNAVRYLLNRRPEALQMGQNGREAVRKHRSMLSIAEKLEESYLP